MVETTAVTRGYVDAPCGQIHFRAVGESGRPVVLLHQSPQSSRMYERAYPLVAARGLRTIGIDTPGFGMSDLPDHAPAVEEYAEWIAAALARLHRGPVHLVGHHTGAAIAAQLAARHPAAVGALVLSGPPMFDRQRRSEWAQQVFEPMRLQPDGAHLTEAFATRAAATPGWFDLHAMHRGVLDWLLNGDTRRYGPHAAYGYDMEPAVRAINAPTLVLTHRGDAAYEESVRVSAARPDWRFVCLGPSTHDVVDERAAEWVGAVADFVADVVK